MSTVAEKIRGMTRKKFILYVGILGWGVPVFLETTISQWHSKSGWRVPHGWALFFDILVGLLIWPTAGYFFGARLWKSKVFNPDNKE